MRLEYVWNVVRKLRRQGFWLHRASTCPPPARNCYGRVSNGTLAVEASKGGARSEVRSQKLEVRKSLFSILLTSVFCFLSSDVSSGISLVSCTARDVRRRAAFDLPPAIQLRVHVCRCDGHRGL